MRGNCLRSSSSSTTQVDMFLGLNSKTEGCVAVMFTFPSKTVCGCLWEAFQLCGVSHNNLGERYQM